MRTDIKLLVVDDSNEYCELLENELDTLDGISVVGIAVNPYNARNQIIKLSPDVILCDIEMAKMNGLAFIKNILREYHIPTVILTSAAKVALEALELGAIDFVEKYVENTLDNRRKFIEEIVQKVKIAKNSNVDTKIQALDTEVEDTKKVKDKKTDIELIAIGASTGGTVAIANVLSQLNVNIPGIVLVQHIPKMFSTMFASRLDKTTEFEVKEANDGDEIRSGLVLVAPSQKQMRVIRKNGKLYVNVEGEERVSGHCPSVDVLFESVANVVGDKAIGVIMTGMGSDGAKGIVEMKKKGARTIGQDEDSSVVYGMPKEAYKLGGIEKQVPLEDIPQIIMDML